MHKAMFPRLAQLLTTTAPSSADGPGGVLGSLFPSLVTRDRLALLQAGHRMALDDGERLYEGEDRRGRLYCVVEGDLVEHVREGDLRLLAAPTLVGEAAWLVRGEPGAGVADLRARGRCRLLAWDYDALDRLVRDRSGLRAGIVEGMARSLARPGVLLDTALRCGETLTPALKRLHSIAFPSLSCEQFGFMLSRATTATVPAGTIMDTRLHVAVIAEGSVRISRADGHYLDLGEGSFLGEIGWAAPDRHGKEYVVVKSTERVELLRWSFSELSALHLSSPRLYAGMVHGVARDVAVKLSLPMQKVRVMEDAKAMTA